MECSVLPGLLGLTEAKRLGQLVPRLWPFLSHSNCSVRLSCLQVLLCLLQRDSLSVLAGDTHRVSERVRDSLSVLAGDTHRVSERVRDSLFVLAGDTHRASERVYIALCGR